MQQFNVTGMSCAACSARVEKAVNGIEGVTSCSVSLLTNSMGVEGAVSAEDVIRAVEAALCLVNGHFLGIAQCHLVKIFIADVGVLCGHGILIQTHICHFT